MNISSEICLFLRTRKKWGRHPHSRKRIDNWPTRSAPCSQNWAAMVCAPTLLPLRSKEKLYVSRFSRRAIFYMMDFDSRCYRDSYAKHSSLWLIVTYWMPVWSKHLHLALTANKTLYFITNAVWFWVRLRVQQGGWLPMFSLCLVVCVCLEGCESPCRQEAKC